MKLGKSLAFVLVTATMLQATGVFAVEVKTTPANNGVKVEQAKDKGVVDKRIKEPKLTRNSFLIGWNESDPNLIEKFSPNEFPLIADPVIAYNGKKLEYTGKYKPINEFRGMMFPLKATLKAAGIPFTDKDGFITYSRGDYNYKVSSNGGKVIQATLNKELIYDSTLASEFVGDEVFVGPHTLLELMNLDVNKGDFLKLPLKERSGYFASEQTDNDIERNIVMSSTPNTVDKSKHYISLRAGYDSIYAPAYYLKSGLTKDDCKKDIKDKALEITKNAKTDMEKAKVIYDYVSTAISYNHVEYTPSELAERAKHDAGCGAMHSGRGTCGDYAALFQEMCKAVGIPARQVVEVGVHAWNEVWVDGRWVIVDATWKEFDKTLESKMKTNQADTISFGGEKTKETREAIDNSALYWNWYWKQPFAPQIDFSSWQ